MKKKYQEATNFELTQEMKEIFNYIEQSNASVFLTGKAGSGKSTFLTYIRNNSKKNIAVVAPTGIAAQNIKAQTIHSFFGFRFNISVDTVKRSENLARIVKKLDILIIDEISMVRADLIDCIDKSLKIHKQSKLPFGGVQILFIGDMFQLPPVLTKDDMISYYTNYKTPYFFDAKALENLELDYFELTNIFRQNDQQFINFLNSMRSGELDEYDFEYSKSFIKKIDKSDEVVYIVSTNLMADKINREKLDNLNTSEKIYYSNTTGKYEFKSFPAEEALYLKIGAKVMLLNNDYERRWVNGDIGEVHTLGKDSVNIKLENGKIYEIGKHTWESVKFNFDEEESKVIPEVTGAFSQLPLKLAWATTVHKSQGKTLNKIHIDFGSGVFAPGQAYVAFSRARNPEGISIARELTNRDIIVDYRINDFINDLKRLK